MRITNAIRVKLRMHRNHIRSNSAARETAMAVLGASAKELGANAVVGVDLDYEVLGQNNGMLMVSVSGTAVVTE
jgi:uncharacterized protein YbjQ (UPF0145 family)